MAKDCTQLKKCRLCDRNNLSNVLDLGYSPLANSFKKKKDLKRKEKYYPLKVNFCQIIILKD